MTGSKKFSLIIVAAGSSSRMGGDFPKQYIEINGKTILRHSIDIFTQLGGLENICVVINPAHEDMFKAIIYDITPESNAASPPLGGSGYVKYCHGGKTRKDSVYNGIKELSNLKDEDIILVHDAARPFAKPKEIHSLLEAMDSNQAASLAVSVVDTLRYSEKPFDNISRENLWAVQTPQAFHYGDLKRAHEKYSDSEYTDDTSLISKMGIDVKFVMGSKKNFKITMKEDLELAKIMMYSPTKTRIGQGFDVHAFDDSLEVKTVRLCGVDIPHNKPLKGHSDADVALHALTDAILGAIGQGDIGSYFPPSNDDFKDMDSAKFIRHAMRLLRDKGGELINADITIICEAPKIGVHRDKIIKRLAEIMEVCKTRINVKATTTEKLGFTGRGEGIAAQAIVSISI